MKKSLLLPLIIIVVGVSLSGLLLFSPEILLPNDIGARKSDIPASVTQTLRKVDLEIQNMFCIGCRSSVVSSVMALPGVIQADADPRTDSGWVVYDPAKISKEQIVASSIFQAYTARILDDQSYDNVIQQGQAKTIPPEIEQKLKLLAQQLQKREVSLESFFQEELDEAIREGFWDKANNLLDNYLQAYQ